jgi:hypothetical protein
MANDVFVLGDTATGNRGTATANLTRYPGEKYYHPIYPRGYSDIEEETVFGFVIKLFLATAILIGLATVGHRARAYKGLGNYVVGQIEQECLKTADYETLRQHGINPGTTSHVAIIGIINENGWQGDQAKNFGRCMKKKLAKAR